MKTDLGQSDRAVAINPEAVDADRADAARYRWLRDFAHGEICFDHTQGRRDGGHRFVLHVPFDGQPIDDDATSARVLSEAIDSWIAASGSPLTSEPDEQKPVVGAQVGAAPPPPTLADIGVVYEEREGWHTFKIPAFPGVYVVSKDRAKAASDVLPSLAKLVELDTRGAAPPLTDERAAFEKFVRGVDARYDLETYGSGDGIPDGYAIEEIDLSWMAWQARAAMQHPSPGDRK